MSKKNNLNTRRNAHSFDLQREAAAKKKREEKAAKKQRQLAAKPELKKKQKNKKAAKNGLGVRIRKHVTVAGIKVKDAASKKAAKEAIKARREVTGMDLDEDAS